MDYFSFSIFGLNSCAFIWTTDAYIQNNLCLFNCVYVYLQKVTFLDWLKVTGTSFQMAVIFNEEGLKDLMPPCVVQQFVNHNAVLFKVTVMVSFHGW